MVILLINQFWTQTMAQFKHTERLSDTGANAIALRDHLYFIYATAH
jgi:hypothetical protein